MSGTHGRPRRGAGVESPPETRHRVFLVLLGGGLTILYGILVARLAEIQLARGQEFASRARRYHALERRMCAPRGRILDRRGGVLAESLPVKSVELRPYRIGDREGAARALAEALHLDEAQVLARMPQGSRYSMLHEGIESNEEIRRVEAAVRRLARRGIGGIDLHDRYRRFYPQGRSLAHVVGFVGREGSGLEGIEARFDAALTGRMGREIVERDGRAHPFYSARTERRAATPGADIRLTVDLTLQHFLEREVERASSTWQAESVMGLVVSPRDGRILALANRPAYDPNRPGASPADARRNRVITDALPPGSTFKAFTLAAGLEAGVVSLSDRIDCENGLWNHQGRVIHDVHPTGETGVPGVLVHSSNIGAAKIGLATGGEFLRPFLLGCGFGRPTGIRLSGEATGSVTSRHDWTEKYTTVSVSFGQEIAVTPLQLVMGFCAIANGGWLLPPRLVEEVVLPDGSTGRLALAAPRRVLDPRVAEEVAGVLVRVVEEGSGRAARLAGYSVAGKTGTAEKIARGTRHGYVSTFAAFAPASDPALCALLVVNDPKGARYASTVAAPGVGRLLADALAYLGVPPDRPEGGDAPIGRMKAIRQP